MKVRAKTRCFVDNCLREENEEFEYDGPENGNLECLDRSGKPGSKKASGGIEPVI